MEAAHPGSSRDAGALRLALTRLQASGSGPCLDCETSGPLAVRVGGSVQKPLSGWIREEQEAGPGLGRRAQ